MALQQEISNSQIIAQISYNSKSYILPLHTNHYIYTYIPQIISYFNISPQYFYLSSEDEIPCNLPIDLIYTLESQNSQTLKLTLHTTTQPNSPLLQHMQIYISSAIQFFERQWRNTVKEACYILNGSANKFLSLSINASTSFWKSTINKDSTTFIKYSSMIIPKLIKNIPLKVYINDWKQVSLITLIRNSRLKIDDVTVDDLMTRLGVGKDEVIVHGVVIPPNARLVDVYKELLYFDMFLYIVIRSRSGSGNEIKSP